MATSFARSPDFKTPIGRLSFAQNLFKPRAQEEGKPPKYGCTLIFPKTIDRDVMDNAVIQVLRDTWGEKGLIRAREGTIKVPFIDGGSKQGKNKDGDFHPGMGPDVFFIRPQANLDRPPVVLYRNPNIQATEEDVYSGCYGFAVLNAYAWSHPKSGDGVSFGIQMFQKKSDGERLSGGGPIDPARWHESIEDVGDAQAETKTGAGAAGLFG